MKIKLKNDVIYRCIGNDFTNGILACGFMTKPSKEQSQYNFMIDYYSCFLVLSGSGFYYTTEDEKLPLQTNDFVQRLPGVCHSTEIVPDGQWLEFFISFGRTTYDYLCSMNLLPLDPPVKKTNYDDILLQRFSRLLGQLKEADENALPFLSLMAQDIVLSMINHTLKASSTPSLKEVMEEACRLLSSEINITISLENLASTLNMSYENFRKQFRKYTGISPLRFRMEQRIKNAKLMLLSGVPIKETAQLTGYSDTYSFTKQFTQMVGLSPGRFKTANKA